MDCPDIEKKAIATCLGFATSNTVKKQLYYLLPNGYMERVSRGIHEITGERRKTLRDLELGAISQTDKEHNEKA